RHRLRQDDDDGRDRRPRQPDPPAPHRDDRGSGRDPPCRPAVHRQPARRRRRHELLPRGPAARAAPGPGRARDRRVARRGGGPDRAQRRRVRPLRPDDAAHARRRGVRQADDRLLPGREAAARPEHPRRRAPRDRQPAAPAARQRRSHRRGRGDGTQRSHRRGDPRGPPRRDPERDPRGRVLRDADAQPGPDRARPLGRGRPRGRRERGSVPPRLHDRPPAGHPAARSLAGERRRGHRRPASRRAGEPRRPPPGSGMRRAVAAAVCAAAAFCGVARGDVFTSAQDTAQLPSASEPNAAGAVGTDSFSWTTPPANPVQMSPVQLLSIWQSAGAAYGIDWQVLGAINRIESDFGRNMGPSSAGAIGWMQFMPSTWLEWGVDADGNGLADPWNPTDAIYSAARYLAAAGGRTNLHDAIFSYNHAEWYVDEVMRYARDFGLGAGGSTAVAPVVAPAPVSQPQPVLVTPGPSLGPDYKPALRRVRRLQRRVAVYEHAAAAAPLLSTRLAFQQRAVLFNVQLDAARDVLHRLR